MKPASRFCGLLLLLPLLLNGCGYGKVDPKTYQYAKALYAICNRQQSEQLSVVRGKIEELEQNNSLRSSEAGLLKDIIAKAEKENWKEAMQDCRDLMNAQVH